MSITEKMVAIKDTLIAEEREAAMITLTKMIHYRVGAQVVEDDTFPLFESVQATQSFSSQAQIQHKALIWVLAQMREEGLCTSCESSLVLSPLGVTKLCKD